MAGSGLRVSNHGQAGQALVLALIILAVGVVAFLRFFHVGQVVAARAKQTHALDAAAYSGALVQARALNMLALLNRAQTGHQLAMAHLVTLGSWAHFAGTQAGRLARQNPPVHVINMMFGSGHGQAYAAASKAAGLEQMAYTDGPLANAYGQHHALLSEVFAAVQKQVVESVAPAREQAMQHILARNYPGYAADFDLSITDTHWPGYVHQVAGMTLRPFVGQVAALYGFLDPRNHTARNPWSVDARCPHKRHELRRRGTTQMDAAGRWQSIDTESYHALRSNRWIGCYFREYPMGWGWVPTRRGQTPDGPYVDQPPQDFSAQDFWRWVQESTDWNIAQGDANPLANSWASVSRQTWEGGGLQPYYDVAGQRPDTLGFEVVLRHPGPEELMVTTQAAAEVFFERPQPRSDGKAESASLFRPYWQARLAPSLEVP